MPYHEVVQDAFIYAAPALTVALVLARPKLGATRRLGPALAAAIGLAIMLAAGGIRLDDLKLAGITLWRPFVAISAIMVTAAVAVEVGLLDRVAAIVERRTRGAVWAAFATVFGLAAATATLLNNDSAILLLTPMIVTLVRRRYPLRQYLIIPFAFAVFAAAGVAPFVISNPINVLVASQAAISFNAYARVMVPVAAAGLFTAFVALAVVFKKEIDDEIPGRGPEAPALPPMNAAGWQALGVLALVFGAYPIVSYVDGPMWLVAAVGALLGAAICHRHAIASPRRLAGLVAWDLLAFLFAVYVMAQGLRRAGVVTLLTRLYAQPQAVDAQLGLVAVMSSLASAVLNNHPMAILNALALGDLPGTTPGHYLAALIGGDLGPRLLPTGSLAGLLWLKMLSRAGLSVSVGQFVKVGAIVTIPALIVSLLVLLALT
jgi:arsenical pump membrane protein